MVGDPAIGFGGLAGLVELRESVILGLVGDIDFNALAGEIFKGVVVVPAVDGLVEHTIFGFVGVVDVDCFLADLDFLYFCVIKTVHNHYKKLGLGK